RSLEHLGSPEAGELFEHVADRHPRSYYGMIAAERLGRPAPAAPAGLEPTAIAFPADPPGGHAERARALVALRLARYAVPEGGTPRNGRRGAACAPGAAPWRALRGAGGRGRDPGGGVRRSLSPLGFWDLLRPQAEARNLDPFFVASVIRQESLFDPEAASPAD